MVIPSSEGQDTVRLVTVDVCLDHLAEVTLVRFLHDKVTVKSPCAAHTFREGSIRTHGHSEAEEGPGVRTTGQKMQGELVQAHTKQNWHTTKQRVYPGRLFGCGF